MLCLYIPFFAAVAVTCWPWYRNFTSILGRCIHVSKMKFLGRGFQKLEHEQDRQTDRQTRHNHYYSCICGW